MTRAPARRICSSGWAPPQPKTASGSVTPWPPNWSTNSSKPPTNANSPKPFPDTGAWTCSALTSWATCNSTAAALRCCSKFSPSGRNRQRRYREQRKLLRLTKTFTDPRLCAAIVDRLTFAGNIIQTGTESYRLAHARAARATTDLPSLKGSACTSSSCPATHPIPTPSSCVAPEQITTQLLELCEQFFRQASPIVHTELRQFLAEHGYHHGGFGWFLDALGFTTLDRTALNHTAGGASSR